MSKSRLIKIATRNSPLALWQANFIKQELQLAHAGLQVKIVGMTTEGDQLLDRTLATVGGKGLFLKELEISLLNNETDIAVHSMKDVPVNLPDGLEIAVVCEREDARDAFVSNHFHNLNDLPAGSVVGTSSLRRTAQLKFAFPDIEIVALRGNVNTRLAKLDNGEYDAIILAAAGLIRLGFERRIKQFIDPQICLPAVGQGIVGIECRSDDEATKDLLRPLDSSDSGLYLAAERAMNAALEGGCQLPVAGFAQVSSGTLSMRGLVGSTDGSQLIRSNKSSSELTMDSAQKLGSAVASDLLQQGALEILKSADRHTAVARKTEMPRVVLTRQHKYLGNTLATLEGMGYQGECVQTLQVEPNPLNGANSFFKVIDEFTDIVFVSRNAVALGMQILSDLKLEIPKQIRVLAVGSETAKQLRHHNVKALYPEQASGAEALLAMIELADLTGRRVLMVRGSDGLTWPSEEMRARGATVDHADIYSLVLPNTAAESLNKVMADNSPISAVFLHSSESAQNFMRLLGEYSGRFSETTLIAGSQRIADKAIETGWTGSIKVAESPSNSHMISALIARQEYAKS